MIFRVVYLQNKDMKNNKIVILSELAQELKIILKLKSTLLISRIKPPEPDTNSNKYFHMRLEFNLFDTSILKINTHEDERIYNYIWHETV